MPSVEPKLFTEKVGFSVKTRSIVPKCTDFSAKTIFPLKSDFSGKKVQFLLEKGNTMCKIFEEINFAPNTSGQQLLELFHEISDIFHTFD